ncbi:hypothetical protein TWF718_000499 [Orbilia javanica]|uniref:F-box domain-containing protein n=1 Tax=Orbilia javanica TaxID=47235 RepID=A0AAN8P185_9PEZI
MIEAEETYSHLPGIQPLPKQSPQSPPQSPPPTTTTTTNPQYLPTELQLLILEASDWKLHPTLAQVCRFWRDFIKSSEKVRLNRYFPVEATTHGFDSSPGEQEFPRPRPWVHRALGYLRQFVVDSRGGGVEDGGEGGGTGGTGGGVSFRACKIELLERSYWVSDGRPKCRLWPDMKWGFFKDDPVTIFPDVPFDPSFLNLAEREIVVSFNCCKPCERSESKKNQIVPLGPVAKVESYLKFVTEEVNYEMVGCSERRKRMGKRVWGWDAEFDGGDEGGYEDDDDDGRVVVVEFWMARDPILVFTPRGFDTDTLRLWFEAKVRRCEVAWM